MFSNLKFRERHSRVRNVLMVLLLSAAVLPMDNVQAERKVSPVFEDFSKKAFCGEDLVRAMPALARYSKFTWVATAVSKREMPMMHGISVRNTITGKVVRLYSDNQTETTYEELNLAGDVISSGVWKDSSCRPALADYRGTLPRRTQTPEPEDPTKFSDRDLNQIMSQSKWGVIYVWSSEMPFSLEGIKQIRKAMRIANRKNGNENQGRLTILLDGKGNLKSAKQVLEEDERLIKEKKRAERHRRLKPTEIRLVNSRELTQRNVSLHFPAAFLYKDGFLSNRSLIGYKVTADYSKWIVNEMKDVDENIRVSGTGASR